MSAWADGDRLALEAYNKDIAETFRHGKELLSVMLMTEKESHRQFLVCLHMLAMLAAATRASGTPFEFGKEFIEGLEAITKINEWRLRK